MEEGESILGAIYEDDFMEDVEMADVEEGELVEEQAQTDVGQGNGGGGGRNVGNQASQSKNRRRRANKKKNKKKRSFPGPNVTDVNRFVLDTCRRLKEKKSYMVYTAVGCLGISAMSDIVKEVDAIQSCGGQMTADGRRLRTGGGILWNIMKTREPMAYKEIMKKTKEFEKQFRQQGIQRGPEQHKAGSTQETSPALNDEITTSMPVDSQPVHQHEREQSSAEGKCKSVHDRIRVPVSYDDLLVDDPKNESA
ncbi:hypothetical protein Tsubulata_013198 [Turnera subulata]|uniref:Phosphorylated adapter RNA export protein n=1 Tax=Turnera subulata TaxID=218843 RepID=A0A9Q0FME8_9ROSI|nr:hypothetical protein Tsubulata_013198 [Turnera subulata]